jgi:nucleoside-diphosphate-sugar epimerase
LIPVPMPVLRLGGRVAGKAGELEQLVGSLTVSTEKMRSLLQWNAPYTADEGLRETVGWFRANSRLSDQSVR